MQTPCRKSVDRESRLGGLRYRTMFCITERCL